ncbi:hypothetical protein [Chelatococcus reniformis]|uniref:Uncharacterized protein n=1 Tax=Chelatococcus reniformis TaxID=1494448 RepID=A0A916UJB0_9HYPH|nr:hypothetical protein [Chelatococcus reniformis]GGC74461.1 hypothetical protein GCM10010994_36140 [Chelatococcus reniformis]
MGAVMPELLVVTAADRAYLPFVLPYAASVLHHNDDSALEIFVPDRAQIEQAYTAGLAKLQHLFPDRLLLTQVNFDAPGSVIRFIKQPSMRATYVYIGDIDILVLEAIAPRHIAIMERENIRYSNEVRSSFQTLGLNKMTGLHFSEYDFYYPVAIPDDIDLPSLKWNSDEDLLYQIVSARTEPRVGSIGRPVHGFHMSHHGWPYNQWGVRNQTYRTRYATFCGTPTWLEMREFFDPRYVVYLEILEATIRGYRHFTEAELKGSLALFGRGATRVSQ